MLNIKMTNEKFAIFMFFVIITNIGKDGLYQVLRVRSYECLLQDYLKIRLKIMELRVRMIKREGI